MCGTIVFYVRHDSFLCATCGARVNDALLLRLLRREVSVVLTNRIFPIIISGVVGGSRCRLGSYKEVGQLCALRPRFGAKFEFAAAGESGPRSIVRSQYLPLSRIDLRD